MKHKESKLDKKIGLIALAVLLAALLMGAGELYDTLTQAVESVERELYAEAAEAPVPSEEAAAPSVTVAPQAATEKAPKEEGPVGPMPQANLAKVFSVYDAQGNKVSLVQMRGKPAIVNFFASWCGPCQMEMPYFDEAWQAYGEDIHFMMVNMNAFGNDTMKNAQAMVEKGGWTFPVYFDTDGEAAVAHSVRSMPTTLFISEDGVLVKKQVGMLTREMLQSGIDALLAK